MVVGDPQPRPTLTTGGWAESETEPELVVDPWASMTPPRGFTSRLPEEAEEGEREAERAPAPAPAPTSPPQSPSPQLPPSLSSQRALRSPYPPPPHHYHNDVVSTPAPYPRSERDLEDDALSSYSFASSSATSSVLSSPFSTSSLTALLLWLARFLAPKLVFGTSVYILTWAIWSKLGRLTHYAFDAVLFSAFLAGMKRSTGLTLNPEKVVGENREAEKWVDKYLGLGEWVMDQSVALAGSSSWFRRTR